MGLFKKKNKTDDLDGLDIPPPPPIESDSSKDTPKKEPATLDSLDVKSGMPEMPPLQADDSKDNTLSSGDDMKGIDIPPISAHSQMPPLPKEPVFPKQDKGLSEPKPFEDLFKPPQEAHKEAPKELPLRKPTHITEDKTIFIEVTKYKQVLKDLNSLKKSLKESNTKVSDIVGDINDEEKIFSELHTNLSDIDQKLGQLENSLFQG
jgi:hypothetical protein